MTRYKDIKLDSTEEGAAVLTAGLFGAWWTALFYLFHQTFDRNPELIVGIFLFILWMQELGAVRRSIRLGKWEEKQAEKETAK